MSSVRPSSARALIVSLGFGTGFWILASFTGTMLDPAHAEPWTTSLMASLLASALIAPALLMAYHHARQSATASHGEDLGDVTPFIDESQSIAGEKPASNHQPTLWPEPQRQETSPAQETSPTRETSPASEDSGGWPHESESAPQKRAA